jgi:hypothetical protein
MIFRKFAGLISIAICAGYLFAGLWPFNFFAHNNIKWLPGSNGIHFTWLSVAYSRTPFDMSSSDAITIELWLEPEDEPSHRIGSILSFYDSELPENLLIGQWKSEVLLRMLVTNAQGVRKYREVSARAALRKGSRRFVVLTSGPAGTAFYVDGSAAAIFPNLTLRSKTLQGSLVLGSAPQGGNQWRGELYGLALFSRALAPPEILHHYDLWKSNHSQDLRSERQLAALYLFDKGNGETVEDYSPSHCPLIVPQRYHLIRKTFFVLPWKEPPPLSDVLVNILGFVPFGFSFFVYRMQAKPARSLRNALLVILVATIISVAIEFTQGFLPTRDSSVSDVVCNSGGALIGVLLTAVFQ